MDIPRHWRLQKERYGLVGSSCKVCGEGIFPPRPICVKHTYSAFAEKTASENVEEDLEIPESTQQEDGLLAQAICSYI